MRSILLFLSFGLLFACTSRSPEPDLRDPGGLAPSPGIDVFFADSQEERDNLAEPFRGISTDGTPIEGLYPLTSTGVSTAPVRQAVEDFLASLSDAQLDRCTFSIDDEEWRRWHNIDIYQREGIGLFELDASQRELAFDFLAQSLSAQGLKKSRDIMAMEEHLRWIVAGYVESEELDDSNRRRMAKVVERLGDDKFYLSFMGLPDAREPWGWQIDGHHLVINYFVHGDQVVMTPTFMGSEPTYAEDGPQKGHRTFEAEESKGLAFYTSLPEQQREAASFGDEKTSGYNQTEAFRDNAEVPYAGLRASELDEEQRAALLELIGEYVHNLRDGHARVKMAEVKAHLDETRFAWIGGTGDGEPFYYRIQSPVLLIEFDHQGPVFVWDESFGEPRPSRRHIHTVVRTPNGNDYGKDLLRQHLESHHQK